MRPFRDLGTPGTDYPAWVRELAGKSGVYVIRSKHGARGRTPGGTGGTGPRAVLYVGESHSGKLYETLTRHVQRWQLPEAHSYARENVEIAVRVVAAGDAQALQREYICQFQPRDNIYDVCEEVPF